MCLILTSLCAICFLGAHLSFDRQNRFKTFTAFLFFAGAALMWSVDGIASLAEGGEFFDLSYDDFRLGLCVALLGITLWSLFMIPSFSKRMVKG